MKWRCLPLVAALQVSAALAQDGAVLPVDDAALAAIDERPAVRAALAMGAAAESRARALEVGAHEFTLGGNWQERDVDGAGSFNEWEATLVRGMRLPGKARVDRDLGGVEIEWAENALADARHAEARRLLEAWFAWLRAEALAGRDGDRAALLERTVRAVRRQAALGEASQMQLELAESEASRASATADRSRISARQARRALQMAYPALAVPAEPPPAPEPVAPDRPLQEWPEVIVKRSHELRLAELAVERAQLRAERASRDRWPDPVVGLRVLEERGGAEDAVGVVVAWQLPGRYRSALAAEGRREAEAAAARLDAAQRELAEVAQQDVADAQAALTSWPAIKAAAEQATRYLARAERAYELGEASLGELLLSVAAATDTIHEASVARLDAHEALARLGIDAHELWAPAGHADHEH